MTKEYSRKGNANWSSDEFKETLIIAIGPCPIGENNPDPFFDSYREELLTARDILDSMWAIRSKSVELTFNKEFLKRMIKGYMAHIESLEMKD